MVTSLGPYGTRTGPWNSVATTPTEGPETCQPVFTDAQACFPDAAVGGNDGMLCEFSDLLDSFSEFLDSTEGLEEICTDAPQSATDASPPSRLQFHQSMLPPPSMEGPQSQPGQRSSFLPSVARLGKATINLSSSTSSSSQCALSTSIMAGLAKSQSGGPTTSNSNSNSNSQSSSSTSSRDCTKEKADESKASGGSSLLAKLKDLCKSSPAAGKPGGSVPQITPASTPDIPETSQKLPAAADFAPKLEAPKDASANFPVLAQSEQYLARETATQGFVQWLPTPTVGVVTQPVEAFSQGEEATQINTVASAEASKKTDVALKRDFGSSQEMGSGEGPEGEDGDTDAEGNLDPEERQRLQRLQRNRQSALQSRQRRKQYMTELEQKCRALESQVGHMRQIVAMTAMENGALRDEIIRLQNVMGSQPQKQNLVLPRQGFPGEGAAVKPGSRRCSRASSPTSPSISNKEGKSMMKEGVKFQEVAMAGSEEAAGMVVEPEDGLNSEVETKTPVAVTLGAEPAALYSDSLPMESLLPTWRQLMGVLFALLLFSLFWAASPLACLPPSLSPLPLGLCRGLSLGFLSPPSGVTLRLPPLALLVPVVLLEIQASPRVRVAKLWLWEEDDPGEKGSPHPLKPGGRLVVASA